MEELPKFIALSDKEKSTILWRLDKAEKSMFKKSVKAVLELVSACKNIDKSLTSYFKKIKS